MAGVGFLVLAAFFGSAVALPFEVHLSSSAYGVIDLTLTNTDPNPLVINVEGTPFGPTRADVFRLDAGDASAVYTGKKVRRKLGLPAELVTLAAGGVITAQFNLLDSYSFSQEGIYTVTLNERAYISFKQEGSNDFVTAHLTSEDTVSLTIGSDNVSSSMGIESAVDGTVSFTNCPADWVTNLTSQLALAKGLAQGAINYLSARSCATNPTVYVRWYGVCNQTAYNAKLAGFQRVLARMNNGFTFHCDPIDCVGELLNAAAFVIPNDPTFTVNICGNDAFFGFSVTPCNFDSQAGVILHEFTHFVSVMDTDDIVSGGADDFAALLALAINNATAAAANSYTQEFFSEETCAVTPSPTPVATATPTPTPTPTPVATTKKPGNLPTDPPGRVIFPTPKPGAPKPPTAKPTTAKPTAKPTTVKPTTKPTTAAKVKKNKKKKKKPVSINTVKPTSRVIFPGRG